MTIVSGLRNKAGESPAPHAIIAGTWLGCVAPAVSQSPKAGTSADQIAAQHIGQDTTLPSLELAGEDGGGACDPGYGCAYSGTVAFRTPTQPLPMEHNPRKVFFRLFGQGDTAEERHAIVNETQSVLDSAKDSAADLQRELGPADRAMLSDYLDSVREIERRVQKQKEKETAGIKLPNAPAGIDQDFGKQLDTMFEVIALAYQANVTRVTTFMMAKESACGRTTRSACRMRSIRCRITRTIPRSSKAREDPDISLGGVARFIKRLATTPDGDGSLLDHSILLTAAT